MGRAADFLDRRAGSPPRRTRAIRQIDIAHHSHIARPFCARPLCWFILARGRSILCGIPLRLVIRSIRLGVNRLHFARRKFDRSGRLIRCGWRGRVRLAPF